MMRYKLLLFLILLPLLTKSKNVRPNRPQSYGDQETNTQFPLIDQLAAADNWKSPSRVISATYSGNPETGRVNRANLIIRIAPRVTKKPANVDIIASQTLANAKTAEEYVSKALEMKHKYDHTTPSSSFMKYDIYEKEQTKRVPAAHVTPTPIPAIRIEETNDAKNSIDSIISADMEKSSSDFHEFYTNPSYGVQSTTTTTTYRNPDGLDLYGSYKDLDGAHSDFGQQAASSNYEVFGTINNINYDNQKSYSKALQRVTGNGASIYPSKQELQDYIDRAVKKYMREMDSESKYTSGTMSTLTGTPTALAEIKTYYRFPSSTVATPVTKVYSMGTHSEFFKPGKKSSKSHGIYSTVKPFVVESYTPDAIDLTVPTKKRPSPIDLSALDVGQSWSHSGSSETTGNYFQRKPHKPKLKFNSQTYHDINALPYSPNRGIIYDDDTASYSDLSSSHAKDHQVGASISFGSAVDSGSFEHEDSAKSPHFTPSMQVLNGVPVTNPYKFNMETLNDIFDVSDNREKDSGISIGSTESDGEHWHPNNYDHSSSKELSGGSSFIFDTYNPKYNNNPEGHGYQDSYKYSDRPGREYGPHASGSGYGGYGPSGGFGGYGDYHRQRGTIGSDMYASGSTYRLKKVPTAATSSHHKRPSKPKAKQRTSKRFSEHNRNLERDLTPPPADD